MDPTTPEEFFVGRPLGLLAFRRIHELLLSVAPDVTVRVSRSQVAFRRHRGFAYLWRPGRYLRHPQAEVVLSLALRREVPSARWKQVAHPSPTVWMHHLELQVVDDLDAEVDGWLREAAEDA